MERQVEPLAQRLAAQVLPPLLDQHAAGATHTQPMAVEDLAQPLVDLDAGLPGRGPQVGALGHLDLDLLVNKRNLGHGTVDPPWGVRAWGNGVSLERVAPIVLT